MAPKPETLAQRITRRARRLIPPRAFRIVRDRCRGRGIEVGGPSAVFQRWNLWPLYPVARALDNYNFARRTIWSATDGSPSSLYDHEFVGEAAHMLEIPSAAYDFLLASHVLEHMANPLKALQTWRRVVRPGGLILLVVPHRDGTFDHQRPITTLDHILKDFERNVAEHDDTHVQEILALHDLRLDPGAGTREAFLTRAINNIEHRSLHHHVFDTELALKLVDRAGLRIQYLDVERPFHICVGCFTASATDPEDSCNAALANAHYWSPLASWRQRALFRSDRRLGDE